MKYNQVDALLKEEEAYQNNLFPTKQPISSEEIKRQLNNSFRSVYSNISKNISSSNFFQVKNFDILPEINYTNQIMQQNNNKDLMLNPRSSIDLNYCLGVIPNNNKHCICFHPSEKFFVYISKNLIIIEDFSIEKNRTQKLITDSEYELQGIKLSFNINY